MIDREGDLKVLAVLAAHGSDLSKPAHTIHFLYFKSMANAKAAGDALRADGYDDVRVDVAPSRSLWNRLFGPRRYSCIAETRAVKLESHVLATTVWMNALAERFEGEYDGWEASVEK